MSIRNIYKSNRLDKCRWNDCLQREKGFIFFALFPVQVSNLENYQEKWLMISFGVGHVLKLILVTCPYEPNFNVNKPRWLSTDSQVTFRELSFISTKLIHID